MHQVVVSLTVVELATPKARDKGFGSTLEAASYISASWIFLPGFG
jgi:hypothetical protein